MRHARRIAKPVYKTNHDAQRGHHYAAHDEQPEGARYFLMHITDEAMDAYEHCADPATCRGRPETINYKDGIARVWPRPAEGWRVFSEVSGKDVTP